ncbi:hypothetical protein B0H14DRAFT_1647003 [Mycena olivaceomarginata]|nr:hypothetical protein B0H14DRAFT_1647003 [Mycena olivaceomarginata]
MKNNCGVPRLYKMIVLLIIFSVSYLDCLVCGDGKTILKLLPGKPQLPWHPPHDDHENFDLQTVSFAFEQYFGEHRDARADATVAVPACLGGFQKFVHDGLARYPIDGPGLYV